MPKRPGKFEGADLSQGQGGKEFEGPKIDLPPESTETLKDKTYLFTTDASKSLATLVTEAKFNLVEERIKEALQNKFAIKKHKSRSLEGRLFRIDSFSTTEEVKNILRSEGFDPATMVDLVAFYVQHPTVLEEQRTQKIIALGTQLGGIGPLVVSILTGKKHVILGTNIDRTKESNIQWEPSGLFLGVRWQRD